MTVTADSSAGDGIVNMDRILLEEVGQFGPYQVRVIALCALMAALLGFMGNEYIFTFAIVNTRCVIPECEDALSSHLDFTPPWISNALPPSRNSFDNCHRYGSRTANMSDSCSADIFDRDSILECEQYVYEHKNSAFYEFDMGCDVWRPNLLGSINLIGMMISLPLTGFVADRWGRRVAMIVSAFNLAWIGSLKFFAGSYISYLLLSLAASATGSCAFTCAYILALENVGPKYRVVAGTTTITFLNIGTVLQGLVAWSGVYWRYLIIITTLPLFLTVSYFWIMPESVRWLLSKGHYEKAEKILKNAAQINGNVLSEKTLHGFTGIRVTKAEKDISEPWLVSIVFKHKKVLLRCIVTPTWWITMLFIYYGLIMSSVGVTGNKYLNFSAVAASAIPGSWTAALLLNRIGRKPLLIAGYWICGICQIAYILIPDGYYWLSLLMYLAGKLTISAVMTTLYIYTAELYPTRHRSRLFNFSSMVGRLGGILAPLTPAFSAVIWRHLPFALFAGMAFLSGLLVTLAPETLGTTLPDTMEDAEKLGNDSPSRILKPLRRLVSRRKCYTLR